MSASSPVDLADDQKSKEDAEEVSVNDRLGDHPTLETITWTANNFPVKLRFPELVSWTKPARYRNIELWKHFGLHSDSSTHEFAWCFDCGSWVHRTGGTTGSMKAHYDDHRAKEGKKRPAPESSAGSIEQAFKRIRNDIEEFRRTARLLLARALVSNNIPPNVLDNLSFREFIEFISKPDFDLPHRTLGAKLIDQLYERMVVILKQLILEADSVSITTDSATMKFSAEPIVTMTAHFMREWKIVSCILAFQSVRGSHDALIISDILGDCLKAWNISDVSTIVNDNGSNFVASSNRLTAGLISGIQIDEQFRCVCHTLQLVLGDALIFKPPRGSKRKDRDPPASHIEHLIRRINSAIVFIKCCKSPLRMARFRIEQEIYRSSLASLPNNESPASELIDVAEEDNVDSELIGAAVSNPDDEPHDVAPPVSLVNESPPSAVSPSHSSHSSASFNEPSTKPIFKLHTSLSFSSLNEELNDPSKTGMEKQVMTTKATRLVLQNDTRWSSTLVMLERFLLWSPAANKSLIALDQPAFSASEMAVVKDLVALLKPFRKATETLQGADLPTISLIWPTVAWLDQKVQPLIRSAVTPMVRDIAQTVHRSLESRFKLTQLDNMSSRTALISCLCDVRFKGLAFVEQSHHSAIIEGFRTMYTAEKAAMDSERQSSAQPSQDDDNDCAEDDAVDADDTSDPFCFSGGSSVPSSTNTVVDEFDLYLAEPALSSQKCKNICLWWEINGQKFPVISRIASRLLSIPSTSAASERIFSIAGGINRKDRAHMSVLTLAKLTCLKQNLTVLDKLCINISDVFDNLDGTT